MSQSHPLWTIDPDDPRAPPREIWARMSSEERARVVAELPSEFPVNEARPPEGDRHIDAWTGARQTLRRWFRNRGTRIYVGGNLPVYYPGETMFSPDVVAVLDVEPRPRESWIVSNEGDRGLDLALEVVVSGNRRKDVRDNPVRYARLGIREYFVFDATRGTLLGFRLLGGRDAYERLLAQAGDFRSEVLDLDLSLERGRLRFSFAGAVVPEMEELVGKLEAFVDDAHARQRQLEAALEEEQRLRQEEQRKREEAEAEVAALRREIERLKR